PAADQAPAVPAPAQYDTDGDADHVAGIEPAAQAPDYDELPLTRSQITDLQWQLAVHGYDPGPADGVVGRRTRSAIRNYQEDAGLSVDGEPTLALLDHLQFTNPPVRNTDVASYDDGPAAAPVGQPRVLYSGAPSHDGNSAPASNYDYAPEAANRLQKIYTVTVQRELSAKGYQPGPIDGMAGARTSAAIRRYQADNGLVVDGRVSLQLLNHLRLITGAQAS
ncbi:MAG: peptidoglycan-binding domain-containing protein, partial [Dongiaceae bacterium]